MSEDFVHQGCVCLEERKWDRVCGQGSLCVFWMGYGKEQGLRYLLSLGVLGKVAAGGHLLSLEKPASTWRPEPARRESRNHAAAPRRPAPAEDRQLPAQEVEAISGEVPSPGG